MKQYKLQCRLSKNLPWFDWLECDKKVFLTTFLDVIKCRLKHLKSEYPLCEWRIMYCIMPEWLEVVQ